jgi:AGZA family xanthine/uracil permease-like MFS transporter
MKKWTVARGDLDGFFGLFIDNLLQLLLIATLCPLVCGFSEEFVATRILPGAALSILAGNLFYAWQARRLMRETGRTDVTALPYGINTVSLIAYIFLIMGPIYRETGNTEVTWKAGLLACLVSGLMEMAGAFVGAKLRRWTPRAALLSTLAGIAITFISMGFVFQIFASPAMALVPMLMILIFYASKTRLPLGIPAGLAAVGAGIALAWVLRWTGSPMGTFVPDPTPLRLGFHPPIPVVGDLLGFLSEPAGWRYLSIIIPMGLFNVIGSLQCLESAAAAGDHYDTRSSLMANGVGSVIAACFGSAFATTIYIGHPGWKALGARHAYSTINGAVIAFLCLVGGLTAVLKIMPVEVALGILLWIGLVMMAQCFQETPKHHALAVAIGLVPSLAAWGLFLIETSLRVAGSSLFDALPKFGSQLYVAGAIALSQGFLISSTVLSAVMVFVIERQFHKAAAWLGAAAALSAIGLIHAYTLVPTGVQNRFGWWESPAFTLGYGVTALLMLAWHWRSRQTKTT